MNEDKIKKRVQKSGPRNIKDAANILGIPQKEYTPSVQEAFASIFNDIESGRRDLEISQNKLDVLERKMSEVGIIICDYRRVFLNSLNQCFHKIDDQIPLLYLKLSGIVDEILEYKLWLLC